MARRATAQLEQQGYTFQRFGEELDEGLSDAPVPQAAEDMPLLLEEVKIGCTLGMLTCLDRPHRLAYILGDRAGAVGAWTTRSGLGAGCVTPKGWPGCRSGGRRLSRREQAGPRAPRPLRGHARRDWAA